MLRDRKRFGRVAGAAVVLAPGAWGCGGQGAPGVATVTAKIFARSEQGQVQVRVGLD